MNVKSILKFFPVVILTILLSCSDDDDKGSSYSFKDQDLSGEIEGDNWTYEEGYVEADTYEGEEVLDFTLALAQDGSICESFAEGDQIFFFVPNAVGLYKLSFDLDSWDGQVVTLLEDADVPNNIIATEGAIEILSITDTEVTGRIDARADKNNHVNGNFTVSFCPVE